MSEVNRGFRRASEEPASASAGEDARPLGGHKSGRCDCPMILFHRSLPTTLSELREFRDGSVSPDESPRLVPICGSACETSGRLSAVLAASTKRRSP
jgi:hypothetical protein